MTLSQCLTLRPNWSPARAALDRFQRRGLLARVRGLELREMQPAEECCGFGGTFAVKFAELSGAMARTKIDAILGTGANTVVGLDVSCLMQIQGALSRAGSKVRTMHLAEVLASR